MRTKITNLTMLVLFLSLPLYGARSHREAQQSVSGDQNKGRIDLVRQPISKPSFLVSGRGAPRSEYLECYRDLPSFQKLLAANGLSTTETATCAPMSSGAMDTYAPVFRATAREKMETSLVLGGKYNSLTFCELEAQHTATDYRKRGTPVLETICKRMKNPDHEQNLEELFQANVVLLVKASAKAQE